MLFIGVFQVDQNYEMTVCFDEDEDFIITVVLFQIMINIESMPRNKLDHF